MARRVSLITKIKDNDLRRDQFNDISSWKKMQPELKGTRIKSIFKKSNGDSTFLFKEPNDKLEILGEIFNSILATELNIEHVQYYPAIYYGKKGVVCERFIQPRAKVSELWEMKELLYRYSSKLQKLSSEEFKSLKGRNEAAAIEQQIDNLFLILEDEFGDSIFPSFFEMIGFDALIGHTDRHWENYGVLVYLNKKGNINMKFAPLYDTVTCYLIGSFNDEQVEKMLNKELEDPKWYKTKSRDISKIKVPNDLKSNHFDLMRFILNDNNMKKYHNSLSKAFDNFDIKKVNQIFKRFFPHESRVRKKAIIKILKHRYSISKQIIKKGV